MSTMIPSPCTVSRRSTAWAIAIPTQTTPNVVIDMPAVSVGVGGDELRGIARPSRNTTGTNATSASSTCRSPSIAPAASPASARKPASLIGRACSYMRYSSCRHTQPSTRMPAAKIQPPATMMKIA
jgi:hypothetical protein